MPRPKQPTTRNSLNKLTKEQDNCTVLPTNILAGPRPKKATKKAADLNQDSQRNKKWKSQTTMNKRSSKGASQPTTSPERNRVFTIQRTTRTQPTGVGGLRNPPSSDKSLKKPTHKRQVNSISMSDIEGDSDSDYDEATEIRATDNTVGQDPASRSTVVLATTPVSQTPPSGGGDRALRSKTTTDQNDDDVGNGESAANYHLPETRLSKRQKTSIPSTIAHRYISPYGPAVHATEAEKAGSAETYAKTVGREMRTVPDMSELEIIKVLECPPKLPPLKKDSNSDERTRSSPMRKTSGENVQNGSRSSPMKKASEEGVPNGIRSSPMKKASEGGTTNGSDGPNQQPPSARLATPVVSKVVDEQSNKSWPETLNSPESTGLNPTCEATPPSSMQPESPVRMNPILFEIKYPYVANEDEDDRTLVILDGENYVITPQDKRRLGLLDQVRQTKEYPLWIAEIKELKIALLEEEPKMQELSDAINKTRKLFEAEMSCLNDTIEVVRDEHARNVLQGLRERQEQRGEEELQILKLEEQQLVIAMNTKRLEICRKEELCRGHYRHAKSVEMEVLGLLEYIRSIPEPHS